MDFVAGLNPRQREAVEHAEGPLLVLAGAGSGKTRVITHRIAHLVSAHRVPGWAILVAANSDRTPCGIRARVRSLLAATRPTASGADSSEGGPTVATFHSFCVRMLRRDGAPLAELRQGFTPRFTIYDDDEQISILKAVYRQLGL